MLDDLKPTQTNELVEPGSTRAPLEIAAELNASALKIRSSRPRIARELYEKAYDLARNDDSCRIEMAASLAGLAKLNYDVGNVELAVNQNFEIISLLVDFPPTPALVDANCNLTWIFYSFGDFSTALNYASKALKAAQELQDNKYWEAQALDVYGFSFFGNAADLDASFKFQKKAARLFGEIGDYIQQARVYNNLADTQFRGGKLDTALEFCRKSLALAREAGSPNVETIAISTLSDVLIAMNDYSQAEKYLQEAQMQLSEDTPLIFKTYILTSLAKIQLMNSQTDLAEFNLLKAIKIARSMNSTFDQVEPNRVLAEIYEQKQEYSKSLDYFKKYAVLNEKLLNERAAIQFHALKVEANLEAAQRDAEIHRLKNVELQNEINERSRIQKELEVLATTDPLTGLFNRRHFFNLVEHEFEQARRFNRAISLVLIDLDDFKNINDTFGHPTGDTVLTNMANIFQSSTRAVDIVCRFGGEEFAILMPETDAAESEMIIQRVRKALEEQDLTAEPNSIAVTFSAGIASFDTSKTPIPADMEILIKWADQALYDAKHAGKNTTIIYSP